MAPALLQRTAVFDKSQLPVTEPFLPIACGKFTLVGGMFPGVGNAIALVGQPVPIVGQPIPIVCHALTIRHRVFPVGKLLIVAISHSDAPVFERWGRRSTTVSTHITTCRSVQLGQTNSPQS